MRYLWLVGMFLLSGCTYNVSQAHTEGQASDVVDTAQTSEAKPAINVPVNSADADQTITPEEKAVEAEPIK